MEAHCFADNKKYTVCPTVVEMQSIHPLRPSHIPISNLSRTSTIYSVPCPPRPPSCDSKILRCDDSRGLVRSSFLLLTSSLISSSQSFAFSSVMKLGIWKGVDLGACVVWLSAFRQ